MEGATNQIINGPQMTFAQTGPAPHHNRVFTVVLQLSIAAFTISLVWFSFIYYPKVVDKFAKVGLPQSRVVSKAANFGQFPIETEAYRITYEQASNTYYAFIEGNNSAQFVDNKNGATLAIKSALSVDSICTLNVIFAPTKKIEIAQDLKQPVNCR